MTRAIDSARIRRWAPAGGPRDLAGALWIGAAIAAGMGVAVGVLWQPLVAGAALAAVLLAAAFGVGRESRLPPLFLSCLGAVLVGYAFLGRGFSHLGVFPVFVGEVALALGGASFLLGSGAAAALRSPVAWVLLAFMGWSALQTAPYWPSYGFDALRDGVLWAYASFAFFVAAALSRTSRLQRALLGYTKVLPAFVLWIAPALLVFELAAHRLPQIPGTGVAVLHVKPGDMAVHLGGAITFLALGMHRLDPRQRIGNSFEWLLWVAAVVGFIAISSQSRGAMLAALTALAVVSLRAHLRRLVQVTAVAALIGGIFFAVGIELEVGWRGRKVSPEQVAVNLTSIVGNAKRPGLEGTREWRKDWWTDIVSYTIFGEHFWTGKGYGVNLATEDGYVVDRDETLRSPHNGTFTVLARSGVPGLALWVLLQASFGAALLRGYLRARRAGRDGWARLDLWILAYWTAFLVNSSFDVFLEGPQGGIWFWSLFGLGLATLRLQDEASSSASPWDRTAETA